MEQVSGYINHIVYANAETGYAVIEIVKDGEELTLVGIMPQISEGEYIQAEGNRITHAVYGRKRGHNRPAGCALFLFIKIMYNIQKLHSVSQLVVVVQIVSLLLGGELTQGIDSCSDVLHRAPRPLHLPC